MADDPDIEGLALDGRPLQLQQARLLKDRTRGSALSVFALVVLYTVILMFTAPISGSLLWFAAASLMIGVTLLLPWSYEPEGVTLQNAPRYLAWHTAISCATGAVWGGGAVLLLDVTSELNVFTTGMMVLGISLGGISPQSAYRRSYVGLASFVLLPYAAALLLFADWPMSATGGGVLLAYAFFMSASARVEMATRDTLAIKQNQALMEQLRIQRDTLKKTSDDKTRFLAATSHDLAQPLHAQGFFLAALREKLTDPAQLDLMQKLEASWRGLGNLLDGLVDVSRLDAGAIVPHWKDIDLGQLASRIAEEFAASASDKRLTFDVDVKKALVRTDPILSSRILRNLLSNAVKFTDAGGTISVVVNPSEHGGDLIVEDTGCGIPAEQHEAVFDEYVQLGNRERNREKGLGLGLSIVRRLTDLLDVRLSLASSRDNGTRFTLNFPAARRSVKPESSGARSVHRESYNVSNLCVLVVDDEDSIRAGMSTVLSSWGCQVISVESGAAVARALDEVDATPDVLIVDQRLGGDMTGLQVIEAVREELNNDVPAIVMSGDISADIGGGPEAGVRYLHKPVEPETLYRILGELHEVALNETEIL